MTDGDEGDEARTPHPSCDAPSSPLSVSPIKIPFGYFPFVLPPYHRLRAVVPQVHALITLLLVGGD
jgi:hypothetical protein